MIVVGNERVRRRQAAHDVAGWLGLAAAPTFAAMAFVCLRGTEAHAVCATMQHVSPWSGMAVMYVLMSAFHAGPWLNLISRRQIVDR